MSNKKEICVTYNVRFKCHWMANRIFENPKKARGRSKDQIYADCMKGLALESAAADQFNLKLNECLEDPKYPGTYDHDLVSGITNERYEVKQAFIKDAGKFGKTLQFHQSIFDIANDKKRFFHYFIFGQTYKVEGNAIASVEVYAIIPRAAIRYFSKQSTIKKDYMYFQDGLANNGYDMTILFK